MGIAMGCIGMSLDDFCRCTPLEFEAIAAEYNNREQHYHQTGWEQTRFLALASLQPHTTHTLRPNDIMPLPWDYKTQPKASCNSTSHEVETVQTQELLTQRYQAAKKRYNIS